MKNPAAQLAFAFSIALLAVPALAQSTEESIASSTPAPVAHVYIQTVPGVLVYAAAANGTLTAVKGSPFPVTGQMEDISGKHLISVGTTYLHVYQLESNGAIGKQLSEINTASYNFGVECGGTNGQGSILDHTGKYLYVLLSNNLCSAWQTYQVESDGSLQFLEAVYNEEHENNVPFVFTVPTISSNDKFGFGVRKLSQYQNNYHCDGIGYGCPQIQSFSISQGVLEACATCLETDPVAPSGYTYVPLPYASPQADPNGHFAVLLTQLDSSGNFLGPLQVASYTVTPSYGHISSTNTYENMPTFLGPQPQISVAPPVAMAMSPAGNLLAVGAYPGLQIFHFNGAAPATAFSGLLDSDYYFNYAKWDNKNHLYLQADEFGPQRLFVYTVTPTFITEAPGSPYNLPNSPNGPYGVTGMVVVNW